jgi:predicted secreted protein
MRRLLTAMLALASAHAWAAEPASPAMPTVSVTSSATTSVANDRMFAWLRAEVDNPDPARAAAEVNARIGKAIARVKGTPGVEVKTSGYSSYQFTDKANVTRWRVQQSISLESSDFAALAVLLTRMQAEDTLVVSGMSFGVSNDARRKAEDALTQEAIKGWQARAQSASKALGYDAWRVGHVSVTTGEPPMRPQPMMRMQASAGGGAPPVNAEGGNTDITVTVSGDAILGAKQGQ